MKKTKKRRVRAKSKKTSKQQEQNPSTMQLFAGLSAIVITIAFASYASTTINKEIEIAYQESEDKIRNSYNLAQAKIKNMRRSSAAEEVTLTSSDIEDMLDKFGEEHGSALEEGIPEPPKFPSTKDSDLEDGSDLEMEVLSGEYLAGDINQDGVLDEKDIDEALRVLNEGSYLESVDLFPEEADGEISIEDIEEVIDLVKEK